MVTLDTDDREAEIVVVNTCSFIYDAEKESVSSIFEMIGAKKEGDNRRLSSTKAWRRAASLNT